MVIEKNKIISKKIKNKLKNGHREKKNELFKTIQLRKNVLLVGNFFDDPFLF